MNETKLPNSLQKPNYDSFDESSFSGEGDFTTIKNVRWSPPESPNAWKRSENRSLIPTTPPTVGADRSPEVWSESVDFEGLDDDERISLITGSTWKSNSNPERSPSRNSLIFWRGSVNSQNDDTQSLFSVTQLLEYVSLTVVAFLIMLIFGLTGLGFDNVRPACDGQRGDHHAPVCDLYTTLKNGATQYQVLAAFILGGFVLSSVDMWRARRVAYGDLCNATRNLTMILAATIPSERVHDRCTMIRWCILAYEICVLKARNCLDGADALEYLQALNLVVEDEWGLLIEGNQNSTVYWWILKKCQTLIDEDSLSPMCLNTLADAISMCRTKGNDLMARNDRDQPRPYCFICAVLVNLNLVLTSLSKGMEWAILLYDSQRQILYEPVLYVELFVLFTFNAIFAMLFDLCSDLYNPFGPRPIDLPHASISKEIRAFAKGVSGDDKIPCTMQKKHSRRNSFILDNESSSRLALLEKKMSKSNRVLGRSMLLRPGKSVLVQDSNIKKKSIFHKV